MNSFCLLNWWIFTFWTQMNSFFLLNWWIFTIFTLPGCPLHCVYFLSYCIISILNYLKDLHWKTFLPCSTLSWATAWGLLYNAYDRDNAYADVDSEAIGQRLYFGMFTLQMLTKWNHAYAGTHSRRLANAYFSAHAYAARCRGGIVHAKVRTRQ